ncbi:lipocalin Cav p 2.0101-like [Dasypus novemcinctus]|uniref:lipocalin Cav p 2.0101-like n=1 Tax=Dasypus novemcinctus TaxID=9361 RepID=UPI0039C999C2
MKILLLSLVLGLVCAEEQQTFSGTWNTIYLAADNIDKIEEDGPLRGYVRSVVQDSTGETMSFDFYVKDDGVCQKHTAEGRRIGENQYGLQFRGENIVELVFAESDAMMFYVVNVDENGQTTHLTEIIAKGNDVSPEESQKFEEETIKKGIPKENILKVSNTDTCPKDTV